MRILICANPDLNYIDGSSIWSQTLTKLLAQSGAESVDFLAKSKPVRRELFSSFDEHKNIRVIDGTSPGFWAGRGFARLQPEQLIQVAKQLDEKFDYDLVVIRGYHLAQLLIESPLLLQKCWVYLTDIPQSRSQLGPKDIAYFHSIATGCKRLLCQSEGFAELWRSVVPELDESKISLYTPVIPDFEVNTKPASERKNKAVYAGKFKQAWRTLDMVEAWPRLAIDADAPELVMIGDKIHDESGAPSFLPRMKNALEGERVNWLGALSREEVHRELETAKIGLSWRCESMNDTLEYSTKVLEYGAAGCGAIINRNVLHEQLFGADYPLFANSEQEFIEKVTEAFTNDQVLRKAVERLQQVAYDHTVSERLRDIKEYISHDISSVKRKQSKPLSEVKTILVAGHDLKFFEGLKNALEKSGEFQVLVDQWSGHNKHDKERSFNLLQKADIIFCEWCLGNLVWYAKHKLPYQKLLARYLGQEIRVDYFTKVLVDSIDHIGFVSDHLRQQELERSKFPVSKTSVVSNYIDVEKIPKLKKFGEAAYTLGMIGVAPSLKGLDRAIDLLERLLVQDKRFILRIKGRSPFDIPWLMSRPDEKKYYFNLMERINSSEQLRYKVIFDPPGDDVGKWLSMVGFILSPSTFESFHMAVAEGMLSGARPVIWDRAGSRELWADEWVVNNIEDAEKLILAGKEYKDSELRGWVLEHYNPASVVSEWNDLINGVHRAEQL